MINCIVVLNIIHGRLSFHFNRIKKLSNQLCCVIKVINLCTQINEKQSVLIRQQLSPSILSLKKIISCDCVLSLIMIIGLQSLVCCKCCTIKNCCCLFFVWSFHEWWWVFKYFKYDCVSTWFFLCVNGHTRWPFYRSKKAINEMRMERWEQVIRNKQMELMGYLISFDLSIA